MHRGATEPEVTIKPLEKTAMESGETGRSGWKFGSAPKNNKMNINILRQEELIAQKKREIEAKMAQQARTNNQLNQKPLPPKAVHQQGELSNKFVNDGSFLQQFLKMQKDKPDSGTASSPNSSSSSTTTNNNNNSNKPASASGAVLPQKKGILIGKRPGLGVGSMLSQFKSYSHTKQTPSSSRASVFLSPDEEEEEADDAHFLEVKEDKETRTILEKLARFVAEGGPELEKKAKEDYQDSPVFSFLYDKNSRDYLYYRRKVAELRKDNPNYTSSSYSGVDPETRIVAEKLAKFVADGGPEVEAIAIQNNCENSAFRFLYETHSKDHRFYRQKVEEFRCANRAQNSGGARAGSGDRESPVKQKHRSPPRTVSPPPVTAQTASPEPAPAPAPAPAPQPSPGPSATKRKRKSRWGAEDDRLDIPTPPIIIPPEPEPVALSAQELRGLGYDKGKPVGLVGVTELSEDQKKQLKEQQEVRTTAVDGAGFGVDRPADLSKDDDEYDAFRKRMMLAYRFRPNPLVRPVTIRNAGTSCLNLFSSGTQELPVQASRVICKHG
ncbi:UNVERIFIED_CONTAM: hypothetical protein FKN15_031505 [Acipenser sinensis]